MSEPTPATTTTPTTTPPLSDLSVLLDSIIDSTTGDVGACLDAVAHYCEKAKETEEGEEMRIDFNSPRFRVDVDSFATGREVLLKLGWEIDTVSREALVWKKEHSDGHFDYALNLIRDARENHEKKKETVELKELRGFTNLSIPATPAGWTKSARYRVGYCDTIGRRSSMEDTMSVHGCFMGQPDLDFFGVFDGHGGKAVADICEEHFHQELAKGLSLKADPKTALLSAYKNTDALTTSHPSTGATAATALIVGDDLWVANAGDARIVLGHQVEGAVRLTVDHKPDMESEKSRIEAAGGVVLNVFGCWRVQGALAVARAIGDQGMSPYVTATPFLKKLELSDSLEFLVIACDGLWDVISDEEAVEAVRKKSCPAEAARYLTRLAFNHGSQDNISVMVVFLKDSF
eukprot:TRINITY_DN12491_c0_g1_i1.p1 TRINITY_DN12491_c0_g1~~TRINITY_DN12491_c0_g1_i1.p1  ORF type:complete len:424 (-),score=84.87 TRINITY_DN12491_c0_g1_i1:315-1526(-)